MAAPTPSARVAPTGIKLKDGYRSLVTYALDTDFSVWEKGVQPAGIDGGDEIDQTTMWNDVWRTSAPRSLLTLTPFTFRFAFDPNIYNQADLELINRETTITERFSDGSTLAFYGFMKMIDFDEMVEGEQPEGTITSVPTNFDPTNKVEAGPVLTSVAGT